MCVACNLPWLDLENHVAPQATFGSGILSPRDPTRVAHHRALVSSYHVKPPLMFLWLKPKSALQAIFYKVHEFRLSGSATGNADCHGQFDRPLGDADAYLQVQ